MNDTYVYVLAFNIYFHYTVEKAKLKASNVYGHWVGKMTFPNEQCMNKRARDLTVSTLDVFLQFC